MLASTEYSSLAEQMIWCAEVAVISKVFGVSNAYAVPVNFNDPKLMYHLLASFKVIVTISDVSGFTINAPFGKETKSTSPDSFVAA